METYWPLVNELEQAWTGVEESDRAIISNLVLDNHRFLIMVCLVQSINRKLKGHIGILYGPSGASMVR